MKRLAFVALALAPALALAHHGWSEYDQTKTLTLDGRIEEMGYEHPARLREARHRRARPGSRCSRRRRAWTTAACRRRC